jgi:hypothetical protein
MGGEFFEHTRKSFHGGDSAIKVTENNFTHGVTKYLKLDIIEGYD